MVGLYTHPLQFLLETQPVNIVYVNIDFLVLTNISIAEKNIKELLGYDVLKRLTALLISQEKGLRAYAVMCLAACMSLCEQHVTSACQLMSVHLMFCVC